MIRYYLLFLPTIIGTGSILFPIAIGYLALLSRITGVGQ